MNAVHTPQSIGLFALAHGDITPPVGIYHRMWGAATHDRSEGVHRPLRATALVLGSSDNGSSDWQAIVAIDHCLLFPDAMRHLEERLVTAAALPAENIVVTFSHTHAAGLMDPARSGLPGGELIEPYLDELVEKTATLLHDAAAGLEPVTITYSTGHCALAAHRDYLDESSGEFVCGFDPATPADDTVLVARVTGADGDTVATLVNYACHPTTLAAGNRLISPDYPGAMRELVEDATGKPCVFLQGASGDLGPREGYVGDSAVADRNGRQLGHAVLATLESMPPPGTRYCYRGPLVSGATLGIWEHESLDATAARELRHWAHRRQTIDLRYRADLPDLATTRERFDHWQRVEDTARSAGEDERARDARAMAERMQRQAARLEHLPPGESFPCRITMWRCGDAIWLALPGEPYNLLQRALRERFPQTPIVVMVLDRGWGLTYVPTAQTYGKGIYQEGIAVVEAGSLERMIEAAAGQIDTWEERRP